MSSTHCLEQDLPFGIACEFRHWADLTASPLPRCQTSGPKFGLWVSLLHFLPFSLVFRPFSLQKALFSGQSLTCLKAFFHYLGSNLVFNKCHLFCIAYKNKQNGDGEATITSKLLTKQEYASSKANSIPNNQHFFAQFFVNALSTFTRSFIACIYIHMKQTQPSAFAFAFPDFALSPTFTHIHICRFHILCICSSTHTY